LLAARAASSHAFDFLAAHDIFVVPDGRRKPGLTLDGTHLTAEGYQRLAAPIAQHLRTVPEISTVPKN
jgi:lysophospholipase L1-like esterase